MSIEFIIPVKPRTKKNHSQLVTLKTGRQMLLPSKTYKEFEKEVCNWIKKYPELKLKIDKPINLMCVFYKDKNYKSDLVGYLQAIQDALVKAEVLADDNTNIVATVNGSEVWLDRENPRIEICITFKQAIIEV